MLMPWHTPKDAGHQAGAGGLIVKSADGTFGGERAIAMEPQDRGGYKTLLAKEGEHNARSSHLLKAGARERMVLFNVFATRLERFHAGFFAVAPEREETFSHFTELVETGGFTEVGMRAQAERVLNVAPVG